MTLARILTGDALEQLRTLTDASVRCCVTSPPYWGLRDYGHAGQIGLEPTPEQYVERLVAVFREVRRVLADDGTVFLNLGDSYFGGGGHSPDAPSSKTSKSGKYGAKGALIAGHTRGGVLRAVAYDNGGTALEGSLASGCLCESLCGACRMAYRIGKSHSGSLPAPTRESSPSVPTHGRRESERDHSPTLDFAHRATHSGASTRDCPRTALPVGGRPRASSASMPDESSPPHLAGSRPSDTPSACRLCGCSLGADAQEIARMSACTCDTAAQSDASCGGTLDTASSGLAYPNLTNTSLKSKDLVGIPWRVAFALQADGWVLRSEIIWSKPNPMPESVTDRPTKSHEQIFLFSKASWRGPAPGRFASVAHDDARWLAALIDCEGSIVVKRGKADGRADVYAPQVSIGNTSRSLVDRVAAIVGHGNVLERPGKNAPMFYWQVTHGLAADFLRLVYPHLVIKQRQARIGVYVDSLLYRRGGQKPERKHRTVVEDAVLESLWRRNKECNHFGSPDLSDVPDITYGGWGAAPRYYFDAAAIAEPVTLSTVERISQPGLDAQIGSDRVPGKTNGNMKAVVKRSGNKERVTGVNAASPHRGSGIPWEGTTRNARTVWTIATQPYKAAHFATFPEELARRCILAGSAPGDTVLDPFGGSGTVGQVATGNGRSAVLVEINPAYVALARERIGDLLVAS